ncbi:hypothetical protein [Roseovarius sp. D0-M9]|uniref:hypothetical protein n=1 Tax=Roseovarius sp. D0-M9 TaxID=3127117 RepID=UPI00300FE13A
MRLKITSQNHPKIQAALDAVNGRATSFTICNAHELDRYVARAEKQLARILPKGGWKGARVKCMPAGPSAKSYKYGAKSTEVWIERGASAWFVVGISEGRAYPRRREYCDVSLTAGQTRAATLYADKRLHIDFGTQDIKDDMSNHARVALEANARKLAGIA